MQVRREMGTRSKLTVASQMGTLVLFAPEEKGLRKEG